MARFDVFRSKSGSFLLLDLQSHLLGHLKTRVVVPLYPVTDMSWSMNRLNPRLHIEGVAYVMATQRLAAVSVEELGSLVTGLSNQSDAIITATDFLFQGF